ncbi:WD40/YVTN/BNR-like repeat-containing protein [Bacteroidota bacterium]
MNHCKSLIFLGIIGIISITEVFTQDLNRKINSEKSFFDLYKYRCVGPTRGGRVTTVEGVESQPGVFYMGSTGGGVWKTVNYGQNWNNISDGYFASPSIGAIRTASSNPDVIYVGTGSDGLRSNVITGKGVYKSVDAGKSWEFSGLKSTGLIGAVEIHPDNPDIVFVAAIGQAFQANKERGVYRSLDGGKNWENILFHSDTVGAVDIEFSPDNPQIVYASMWRAERKPWTIISGGHKAGGIYKSTDGGNNWVKIEEGLPQGLIGKIDLAVTQAAPNKLYAIVEAPNDEGGLYISDNYGETFEQVSSNSALVNRPFYYCNVEVDPQNPDIIHSLAGSYVKSTDGGKSWGRVSVPHGDNHDIWINPDDSNTIIQANDGGVNVTRDGGKTWSTQYNQPTAEIYQVELDDQFFYWLYGGQQDNSTIAVPSIPPYSAPGGASSFWMSVGGCETGPAVPKPGNHNIVYSNCKGNFGVYDKRTGQERQYHVGAMDIYSHNPKDLKYRFQRVAPIHVSPHNPDVVYHGSQYLHKTTDDGVTWETISPDLTAFEADKQVISGSPITRDITGEEYYSTIYSIRESKIKNGLIWIGANDGPVHVTLNGGEKWDNVTPSDLPPGGRVDCVEPSSHKEGKAYIAVLRYQLGDWKPYIYKTLDYGKNWKLLTTGDNGIPNDFPTRVVREDPDQEGLLYAGTEYGLFISVDDGINWVSFQQNLPITPITDIKIYRKDLVLSTMGRSFWIMDNLYSLQQLANTNSLSENVLFKPKDTYRLRYRAGRGDNIPSYPAPSVAIDYYLKETSEETIKLEILNEENDVIKLFVSGSSIRSEFKNATGLHRLNWDMKPGGPENSNGRRSQGGPMVIPGKYSVRLTVGEDVYNQSFELLADPRLEGVSIADLKEQEEFILKVMELSAKSREFTKKITDRRKELAKLIENNKKLKKNKAEDEKLAKIVKELNTERGTYMQPMLNSQINYLSSMLGRADQKPGKDAYERYGELNEKLKELIDLFEGMK